ncbi:helix-turn-helix transcriptional regulator [Streptomyces paromomycinus]|uniref:helix-turn-helix transcriptional regulator n=1 Tax=Streptomyces paromomycinus TaxID=92743 RepID=UPI000F618C60|nr:helix-turn-helix transcriptional regulator [Streptomyces paromomycinus]
MPRRSFSPQALAHWRSLRGFTVRELARAVRVTERAVQHWEAGTHVPAGRAFGRLLRALGCDAQDLFVRQRGTETLEELRRDAGLSAAEACRAIARKRGGAAFSPERRKLRELERGQVVRSREWETPEGAGRLVRLLAQVYGVPERVITDAWRRTRPAGAVPLLPERAAREASPAAAQAWEALNSRQRTYLTCIFQQDQEAEEDQRHRRLLGGTGRKAVEWRRMDLALYAPPEFVGHTRIQSRLRQEGVHDPGAGSSVAALERRGLVVTYRDRVYVQGLGEVRRTRVELTRRGRAVARRALGVVREKGPPPPLMSQWLWRILVRVALAGSAGVDGSLAGRGPHFLAVGRSPDGRSPARGFIELRHPDGAEHGPYRWFVTESGMRHIRDHLDAYRELYPDVDADRIGLSHEETSAGPQRA